MPQGALLVGQGQIRIQQIKVDARATGFFQGLVRLIHDATIGKVRKAAKNNPHQSPLTRPRADLCFARCFLISIIRTFWPRDFCRVCRRVSSRAALA